jgi:hypothetical protein
MANTLEEILAELKKINKASEDATNIADKTKKQIKSSTEALKEQNQQYEEINKAIKDELALQKQLKKEIDEAAESEKKALKEKLKFSKEYTKSLREQTKAYQNSKKFAAGAKKGIDLLVKAWKGYNAAVATATGVDFQKVFSYTGAREAGLALNDLGKSITKVGGLAGDFQKDIIKTTEELKDFAILNEDVADSTKMLINSMSRFTLVSSEQRRAIRTTVLQLQKARNAGSEAASSMDILNTVFGKSAEESNELTLQLSAAGEAMGIPPQKMLAAFAQASPRLAVLGGDIRREFLKIAATAKATGAEFSSIIQISEGFDTFEEAARRTSQLNAMFGTQLNSVQLLRMESDEQRIAFIKNQLMMQGQTLESIGKFGRLSLAKILGTDVKTLRQAFRDVGKEVDMAVQKAEQTDVNDYMQRLKDAMSIKDETAAAMQSLENAIANNLIPALEMVPETLRGIKEDLKSTLEFVGKAQRDLLQEVLGTVPKTAKAVALGQAAEDQLDIRSKTGTLGFDWMPDWAKKLVSLAYQNKGTLGGIALGALLRGGGGAAATAGAGAATGGIMAGIGSAGLAVEGFIVSLASAMMPILATAAGLVGPGVAVLGANKFAEYMENQIDTVAMSKGLRGPITLEEMGLQPLPGEQIGSGGASLPPVSIARGSYGAIHPPAMIASEPTAPTQTTSAAYEGASVVDQVAKALQNVTINVHAQIGDKEIKDVVTKTAVDAVNKSYPLDRAIGR